MTRQICNAPGCAEDATHVLVNYYRQVLMPPTFFCAEHAFDEGRQCCRHCEGPNEEIEVDGQYYRATFPEGTLDSDGFCSDHGPG